jgi:hypothetical protein
MAFIISFQKKEVFLSIILNKHTYESIYIPGQEQNIPEWERNCTTILKLQKNYFIKLMKFLGLLL